MSAGLANLHNARRAGSPVVNIIGGMATWHEEADPLLAMGIEDLARTVCTFVRTSTTAHGLACDTSAAFRAAMAPAEAAGASRIATLVVPHDLAWTEMAVAHVAAGQNGKQGGHPRAASPAMHDFLSACAAALKAEQPGKAALYLGGEAVLEQGPSIDNVACTHLFVYGVWTQRMSHDCR